MADFEPTEQSLGKFASPETIGIILESAKLQWSRPTRFNDPFDCETRFNFAPPLDEAKPLLLLEFSKVINGLVTSFSLASPASKLMNAMREGVQQNLMSVDEAERHFLELCAELFEDPTEFLRKLHSDVVLDLHDSKILCLTKSFSNILMWSHYGANHTGAILVFEPNATDSQFSIARPINYRRK